MNYQRFTLIVALLFFGTTQSFSGNYLTLFKAAPYAHGLTNRYIPGRYEQQETRKLIPTLDNALNTMNELLKDNARLASENSAMEEQLTKVMGPKKSSGLIRTRLLYLLVSLIAANVLDTYVFYQK